MRHEPVRHLLRHQVGRARTVTRERLLTHALQARAAVQLAEQPRCGRMQHITENDGPRRRRDGAGLGTVVGEAAVHDAGDLDRCRVPVGC